MAEPATKLPIKTEKKPSEAAPVSRNPLESLRREIDRVFDSFHTNWRLPFGRSAFDIEHFLPRELTAAVAPAVDVTEKEKSYEVTAELPGMDDKDIEVKVANGMLTIKGEKREEKEEKQKDYYLSERRYGSFQRTFAVPEGVDVDKIEANFAKGVLTVTLPKTAEAQKAEKKINVKAA
ncbi:MAG: Hsp20/alpha crystallin family protein [Alphaproteobacteria bacterium]|nr:Hsp20/alpha crystallin family protein [Alphaproteobacteria bacterium]